MQKYLDEVQIQNSKRNSPIKIPLDKFQDLKTSKNAFNKDMSTSNKVKKLLTLKGFGRKIKVVDQNTKAGVDKMQSNYFK